MASFAGNESRSYEDIRPTYLFYSFIILAALNVFLTITASIGNILILVALHKESSLHPPSKFLLRCLALTDLCAGLILQPVFATILIRLSVEANKLWDFTSPTEVFMSVAGAMLCGFSLSTITTIAVDRLLALLLRLRYRQVVTLRRVRVVVMFLCLASSVIGFLYVWEKVLYRYVLCIASSLCLIVSTFCYTKIYARLRHQQVQVQNHLHQGQPNGSIPMNFARYKKTVSTALCVHLSLVVCYLPYAIVTFLRIKRGESPFHSVAMAFSTSLVLFNSSLNPVLYCWRIREVRQAVKETTKQLCC